MGGAERGVETGQDRTGRGHRGDKGLRKQEEGPQGSKKGQLVRPVEVASGLSHPHSTSPLQLGQSIYIFLKPSMI